MLHTTQITMVLINSTNEYEIYQDTFKGTPVRFFKDRQTGEIKVSVDDMAKVLGYKDEHEMLSQDEHLDALNEAHKRTGVFPLKTINL